MTASTTYQPAEWATLAQSLSFTLGLDELPTSLLGALRDASDDDRAALVRLVTAAGASESATASDIAQLLGVSLPPETALVVTLAHRCAKIHFEPGHVVLDLGAGCWELSRAERRSLLDLAELLDGADVRAALLRVLLDGVRRRRARIFRCGRARLAIEPERVSLDLGDGPNLLDSAEIRSLGSLRDLLLMPIVRDALQSIGGAR